MDNKKWALLCAVIHYGLGNLSKDSKPPRAETVIETAGKFENYLNAQPTEVEGQRV